MFITVAMVTLSVGVQLGTVILSGSCDHHHHDYLTEEGINFKVCDQRLVYHDLLWSIISVTWFIYCDQWSGQRDLLSVWDDQWSVNMI